MTLEEEREIMRGRPTLREGRIEESKTERRREIMCPLPWPGSPPKHIT